MCHNSFPPSCSAEFYHSPSQNTTVIFPVFIAISTLDIDRNNKGLQTTDIPFTFCVDIGLSAKLFVDLMEL